MPERPTYPYKLGEYGIQLPPTQYGEVKSESGRLLKIHHQPNWIYISDVFDRTCMEARVEGLYGEYKLKLNLHTRGHERKHHPDMFASCFVNYALTHFEKSNYAPLYFIGYWNPDSDNYAQYQELRRSGASRAEAARFTWTGRQADRHGFSHVKEIMDIVGARGNKRVYVVFAKSPQ